ncbi:flagellar basal body rod protein [Alkalihalobacillus sp. AL-G]|uniref:lmo0954 family membrane protein n=1 Tax=Alkalihalobacillus sp. AL-G TaxID=2926399 RepID=UPI0027299594|nr:flagellar basal body rod protein [Alkalihalobacillus sp. AL-G]WLD93884.1 flagellar basal body rod protein [Alkalihalobacillus sp. AL-G]
MKKFGLLVLGGIAAIVLLANLGPMIGLAISLVILYYSVKQFTKTDSTGAKVGWAIVGLIALAVTASNVPAVLGIAALYILYVVYKNWNKEDEVVKEEVNDPFTNFERQWSELKRS